VLERLAELRTRLDLVLPGVRWTAAANLHFTLRFFGDIAREEAGRAAAVLEAEVPARPAFRLELAGVGVFPDWKRPRILWAGTGEGGERLQELTRGLERGFREAGLGTADKPFVPHLTLGRWRDTPRGIDPDRTREMVQHTGPLGSFDVTEVRLVRSVLGPGGSIYTPLQVARLAPGT
jgi:2'-5' RNA ligase